MGWDSFGMPAENAAIKENAHPHDITERNMASITEQIKRMGFSYDWRRQVKSHDPRYYKWNQFRNSSKGSFRPAAPAGTLFSFV